MNVVIDYYALLGVERNASLDEIKRAYSRKQRENARDEEKLTQLNVAYELLRDEDKRKHYDIDIQYKKIIENLVKKLRESENHQERQKILLELKGIYLDILKKDRNNTNVLVELSDIEDLLGNDTASLNLLKEVEGIVTYNTDKIVIWRRLGEKCRQSSNIDGAIDYYQKIYQQDISFFNDIQILARLYYEQKKNIKSSIQILNDCINRSSDSRLKIQYLYECLRAIRLTPNASYAKVEEAIYNKLKSFYSDNGDANTINAASIVMCFEDIISRKDFTCFHRFEDIFLYYKTENDELYNGFKGIQQLVAAIEKGKVHKVIFSYLEDEWTKEIREEVVRLIHLEAINIKPSLEYLKTEAPLYWSQTGELMELEKAVYEYLDTSKEYQSILNDRAISSYMKKIIEVLLLDGYMDFSILENDFITARDNFFSIEDKSKAQYMLNKMQENYPLCYKLFSDIFFKGNKEVLFNEGENAKLPQSCSSSNDSNNDSRYVWIGIATIAAIVIACISYPPLILIIYLVVRWIGRNEDKKDLDPEELQRKAEHERLEKIKAKERRKKLFKWLKIIIAVILLWTIVSNVYLYVKEKSEEVKEKRAEIYQESHDNWLTEEELKNVEKLHIRYDKKTDVAIRYLQGYSFDASEYDYDDRYIYLVLLSSGQCSIYSNVLDESEQAELASEVWTIFDEDLEDYKKCERFFEMAFTYIKLANVSSDEEINEELYKESNDTTNEETNETIYEETDETIYEETDETIYEETDLIESYIYDINKNIDTSRYGLSGYNMVYINNDDIPELVLLGTSEADGNVICTYVDGEFYYINLFRSYFYFIPYQNVINNSGGNMGYYYDYIYSITNNGFNSILNGEWESNFDESENVENNFRIDGNDVSIEDYAQSVDKYYGDSSTVASYALKNYSSVQEAYDGLMNNQNIDYSNNTYSDSWEEDSEDLLLQ
jgi:curved DNA-binding protein CbpA